MKQILWGVFLFFLSLASYAAGSSISDSITIFGNPKDIETDQFIVEGIRAELVDKQGNVVDTASCKWFSKYHSSASFYLYAPDKSGEYTVIVTHPKYKTIKMPLWKLKKKEDRYGLGEIYMNRAPIKAKVLNEAVVKATKVKFFHRGDTLIYNADAFQLSEGSMLDALISQLPGAELRADGKIYVNGTFVESLLLNGRDFFKGNNSVMLENMPSYMVKDIKVYNKQSEISKMMGMKEGEGAFVMDVNLKRQYSLGWIANAEIGGGTSDRWLARLFALRFTTHSRLMFYGNANNVNESRKPGQTGNDWNPNSIGNGVLTTKSAGFDYDINNIRKKMDYTGNMTLTNTRFSSSTNTATEYFQQGYSTFARKWNNSQNLSTKFSTQHNLQQKFLKDKLLLSFVPNFSYQNWHNRYGYVAAEFTENPDNIINLQDSISLTNISNSLLKSLIYRNTQQFYSHGYSINGGGTLSAFYRIPHQPMGLSMGISVDYNKTTGKDVDEYQLQQTASATIDKRNRLTNHPSEYFFISPNAGYDFYMRKDNNLWSFYTEYSFSYSHNRKENSLYRLEQLSGALPSESEALLSVKDENNSYLSTLNSATNNIKLNMELRRDVENNNKPSRWFVTLTPTLSIRHDWLFYEADINQNKNRTKIMPSVNFKAERRTRGYLHDFVFTYRAGSTLPSMHYLLGRTYDSDPLNIQMGNENLKRQWTQNFDFSYKSDKWLQKKKKLITAGISANVYTNSIATGYTYNRQTGVRTYRPDNVNGNWDAGFRTGFSTPIDSARRATLNINITNNYYNNNDLIGVEGETTARKSTVRSNYLQMPISIEYGRGKWKAGVKGRIAWNHATSNNKDFENLDAADLNYGIYGQTSLPLNMQLATDLTIYSRRGYSAHEMNSDDIVWNASLSKRLMRGNLVLSLVAFDILHQLSSVSYSVNSQAKVETWRNVIPRYAMLRIIYRLNKEPKKKK